jgi:hypothetical protein
MKRRLALLTLSGALVMLGSCGGGGGGNSFTSPVTPPTPTPTPTTPPTPVVTITTSSLPPGVDGTPYSATLTASGGTAPYKWSVAGSPPLPQGFSLASNGTLSGTLPAFLGGTSTTLNFLVTDSAATPNTSTKGLLLDIFGFSPQTLRVPQVGVSFDQNFVQALGGIEPINWSLSGTLMPGVNFGKNPADTTDTRGDEFTGVPSQSGHYDFTISAVDSGSPSRTFSNAYHVDVEPAQLVLQLANMPPGVVGQNYSFALPLTGGAGPFTWSAQFDQKLPAGLQFDSASGKVTGQPTAPGYSGFSVSVSDSSTPTVQHSARYFRLLVSPTPLPSRNDSIATATPIYPGTYIASISPYGDPVGTTNPDQDYYQMTAPSGSTVTVSVSAQVPASIAYRITRLDPVLEIVDSNGTRFATCNDPYYDNPPAGVPIAKSPNPNSFSDPCMNRGGNPATVGPTGFAYLQFKTPGASGNATFFLHIFDWRGDARPDFGYTLSVQQN